MSTTHILMNTQISLFLKNRIDDLTVLSDEIKQGLGTVLAESVAISLPDEEKFDFTPSVQFSSDNGVITLNMGKRRIDLIIHGAGEEDFFQKKDLFFDLAKTLLHIIMGSIQVSRLGFVSRFFREVKKLENIEKIISPDFLKNYHNSLTNHPAMFDIQLKYSNWSKFLDVDFHDGLIIERQSVQLSNDIKPREGVLITRDFNTDQKKDYSSSLTEAHDILNLVEECSNHFKLVNIDKILCPSNNQ